VACRAAGSAPPFTGSSSGASSGSSGGGFGAASPQVDAAARGKRLQDLQALLREAAEIAIATGPRSITRSAQAVSALLSVARDQAVRLQAGQSPEAPAVVLRKLFERLGATYIKLGQFVASRWAHGAG
jgi:aarF domain-containing kinase